MSYQASAVAASCAVTALAVSATWLRFSWHMQDGSAFPVPEFLATLSLVAGGAVSTHATYAFMWQGRGQPVPSHSCVPR